MRIKMKIPNGDTQYVKGVVVNNGVITDVMVSIYPPRKPLMYTIDKLREDLPQYEFYCVA